MNAQCGTPCVILKTLYSKLEGLVSNNIPVPLIDKHLMQTTQRKIRNLKECQNAEININKYLAVIFDLDGVITHTARVHAAAWKRMFDEYLKKRGDREGKEYRPFDDEKDYYRFVDGKPRYEGAESFLESRGISIPYGSPQDPVDRETICGLGNKKNQYFLEHLKENGVESYPSTRDFVQKMRASRKRVAVISSSRNAQAVLEASGDLDLFPVVVDGEEASKRRLKGKPEPDIFLEAARRLEVSPENCIIIEDALSGVEAGRAGGFALVIGIDRSGKNTELKSRGADIVVNDLSQIRIKDNEAKTRK